MTATAPHPHLSLVADIGGTNTRVALATGAAVDAASVRRFRNAEHGGIDAVLAAYLELQGVSHHDIGGVCVAAAGPVRDGVAQMTNLDWRIDRAVLASALTCSVSAVLNDLQAQGHAIGDIAAENLVEVIARPPGADPATRLVVGIGTGFNACPVFETDRGRLVPPSEAGHVALPATVPGLGSVVAQLTERHGFASVEEVLSGRGLSALHAGLHGRAATAAEILAGMQAGEAEARETGRMFVTVMGAVIGDLALSHLPFGGISLIGGMARAFLPWLEPFGFAAAFRAKGRFSDFMGEFGVEVVTDDYAALTGCAAYLARL
ncbi:MAG: glucokinase [Roseicyclus sp.]